MGSFASQSIRAMKSFFLTTVLLSVLTTTFAATFEGNLVSKEGAWCWFADPRALHYENAAGTINSTYIAYIDVHGNIKATQHNFLTGKNNEVLIRSYFQPDDHDVPSFLVLPDERVMIFYSRHTDEPCFYYRVSKNPGDITSLGAEIKIPTAANTTYPSPFILSDDPTHIYLCWRGINWHPTIAKLSIPDANDNLSVTWGPYQMVQSTGARPYCKYCSNGKDKIFLTYTTGHPDNEYPNYIYYNFVDINSLQLKDITGNVLSTIANGAHNVNKTTYPTSYPNAVVDAPTIQRDWVWQTALGKDGMPVVAMVQISNDKTVHNYYYAKWTGSAWRKTFLAYGGGKFHQSAGLELCYSGGMALDDSNPNIVYCSMPVAGTSGTVYEIMKYTIGADGTKTDSTQITTNSTLNNSRPFIVYNSANSPLRLTWMHGNYYDWIVSSTHPEGYPTEIRSDWALPSDTLNLTNGLVANEDFSGTVNGTATVSGGVLFTTATTSATISAAASPAFSISMSPYLYENAYFGNLLQLGDLTYGVDASTQKPFVSIGSTKYGSTNLLGTSDCWQTSARGTGGEWYTPTKLKYFNLTLTYANGVLRVYRNGLIDQVVEAPNRTLSDVKIGGFTGWVEDCKIYNRALNQGEVKKLAETSLAYTLNSSQLINVELDALVVPATISTDVILPTKTTSGNTVTWTSSNTTVLPLTGLVNFPPTTTAVSLTATIGTQSKTFNVTVTPRDINQNKKLVYLFEAGDVYTANNIRYVRDQSGNSNDASVYGTAAVNGALDLTANTAAGFTTNGYAMAPNGLLDKLRSYTFLAKVKAISLTNAPRILDFGSASSNSLLLRASAFSAGFKYNGTTTTLINSSTSLTAGQEAKVALSFDAKTKTTKIYLNGAETANATTITYEPYQLSSISANTRNYIGRTQWWDTSVAASNVDLVGSIDDFMLFDIALTPAEIKQVQDNTTGMQTLVGPKLTVYPNPVTRNSAVNLFFDKGIRSSSTWRAELYNSTGLLVRSKTMDGQVVQLDAVPQCGLYLLRIVSADNQVYTSKLLVN
jgi:hypothetical protein